MVGFIDTVGKAAAAAAAGAAVDVVPRAVVAGLQARAPVPDTTKDAETPVITAFFPQLLGEDLHASVIGVDKSLTTVAMCVEGTCDQLMWTFVYDESTAIIQMTAFDETATISCDVTTTKDHAACTLTDIWSGSTTLESLTLDSLTDFVTTFTVTAGAALLTDAPAATSTSSSSVEDVSSSFIRSPTSSGTRSNATPGTTGGSSNPEETGSAATVPDGDGAAAGLARPLLMIAGIVGVATALML